MKNENLHYFTPLSGQPRRRSFVAFDVEGVPGPHGFWCGACYSERGPMWTTDPECLWRYLTSSLHGSAWRAAHNLEYDLSVLNLKQLLSAGSIMSPSGLLWHVTGDEHGDPIKLIDSLKLFRAMSVRELGELVGYPKLELSDDYILLMKNGYPWQALSGAEQATIQAYNTRDAEIVYRALHLFQDQILALGGELRETLAATSHDVYRRVYMPKAWPRIGPKTNASARLAFYGGRVEPYRMGISQGVNIYDANSLYPYAMQEERFPYPGSLDLMVPGRVPPDLDKLEGCISCQVQTPESLIPPLPARLGTSLYFPTGEWQGVFMINELRYALTQGVQLGKIHWMIATRHTFNPFKEFVGHLWSLRQQYRQLNSPSEHLIKLLLNSHIGRYGVKADQPLTCLEIIHDKFDPQRDQGLIWEQWGLLDYIERPISEVGDPLYANVFFPAQVAARARIMLHESMQRAPDQLVYVDTDAIFTQDALPLSNELGGWKLKMEGGTANLLGPKEYEVIDAYMNCLIHAKGIPPALAHEYLMIGQVRFEQALSIRQAKARRLLPGQWVETVKTRHDPYPKRRPMEEQLPYRSFVQTEPWRYSDLEWLYQSQTPQLLRTQLHQSG